jgi:hypothetical protein
MLRKTVSARSATIFTVNIANLSRCGPEVVDDEYNASLLGDTSIFGGVGILNTICALLGYWLGRI